MPRSRDHGGRPLTVVLIAVSLAAAGAIAGGAFLYQRARTDASPLVQMPGMTLPILQNATVIGPADANRMTEVEFIPKDSPNSTARAIILDWERSNGVTPGVEVCGGASVTYYQNGTVVSKSETCQFEEMESSVTLGQLAVLLHVHFSTYEYQGQIFFANDANPEVPADVAAALLDILGLNGFNGIRIA